ncbi:MAG: methyltransferase, partial [Parahaliea sp.]
MKYGIALILAFFTGVAQAALDWDVALGGEQRDEASRARDDFRHPRQTLEFFGLKEGMTVLEVSPGSGWYTEVIAPLLKGNGTYYAAHFGLNSHLAYYRNSLGQYLQKLAANNDLYRDVIITELQPPERVVAAPQGSVDLAVT